MTWETHPVTPDRFDDSREQAMRSLCEREHPPGVEGAVAYRRRRRRLPRLVMRRDIAG